MKKNFISKSKTLKKISQPLLFCMTFFLILCSAETLGKKSAKVILPNGVSITAELAVTDEERQLGLMFREKIRPDQGMLFVFEEESMSGFWMKNMRFSIDILWLDRERRIVHIERRVPPCKKLPCATYSPKIPAKYVLELKAGTVDKNQLKLFDRLEFNLGNVPN